MRADNGAGHGVEEGVDAVIRYVIITLLRPRQSTDNVGSHEGIALVILPPTPSAVVVLERVKTVHSFLNLFG